MRKSKIIIDTNLWISLLIGKKVSDLRSLCNDTKIEVYICADLKAEFTRVATSEKIGKYVTKERILDTLELMENFCIDVFVTETTAPSSLRDVDDLYLLSLADAIEADYIITGDKDLLILQTHNQTKIVTYSEFIAKSKY